MLRKRETPLNSFLKTVHLSSFLNLVGSLRRQVTSEILFRATIILSPFFHFGAIAILCGRINLHRRKSFLQCRKSNPVRDTEKFTSTDEATAC
ncbi:hypothetical protein CEXT_163881 [Caerostris extrusa]|uniref:Uncharacterized protein n=1 Tax=Caerostris extrusa TaxID=172846 RepID=A0AAV4U8R7_CAEEX|nr:hypothetical protein CEXT_163881 [Caerostris extrusa]